MLQHPQNEDWELPAILDCDLPVKELLLAPTTRVLSSENSYR